MRREINYLIRQISHRNVSICHKIDIIATVLYSVLLDLILGFHFWHKLLQTYEYSVLIPFSDLRMFLSDKAVF